MATERDIADVARELREFAKTGLLVKTVSTQARVLDKCTVLHGLPQIQRADTNRTTPRFEYLVQAIVDAIDDIELSGHRADAAILRVLFGLVDTLRIGDWARRQEQAARMCGVGRDHFRRNLQQPLLVAVAERLLSGDHSRTEKNGTTIADGSLVAVPTQATLTDQMVHYVRNNQPRTAQLLELSTATIGTMLDALRESGTETKLLVANPYRSSSTWQQERVWMTLVDRFRQDFVDHRNLEVRIHDVPPSLRGRLIGEWVSLGWYTYRDDARYPANDPNATLIWGHDNAMVHGNVGTEPGRVLAGWFQLEFERLWRHRLTRRGHDVLRLLGLED